MVNIQTSLVANYLLWAAGGFVILSILLWWIIHIMQRRIPLPTLKVLVIDPTKIPKYRFSAPPLIAFLCFVFSALILTFLLSRPFNLEVTPLVSGKEKVHLFLDMSASISGRIDLPHYAEKVKKFWNLFADK